MFFALFSFGTAFSQFDTNAPYKRFPTVPPFTLVQLDNTEFAKKDLKKNAPVLIMYFSPDCHHCQEQMNDMIKNMHKLSKVQIILATFKPDHELAAFYKRYQLAKYPNIRAGRDAKFILPPFYNIRNFPYFALYDKKGALITTYEGNVAVNELLKKFKIN